MTTTIRKLSKNEIESIPTFRATGRTSPWEQTSEEVRKLEPGEYVEITVRPNPKADAQKTATALSNYLRRKGIKARLVCERVSGRIYLLRLDGDEEPEAQPKAPKAPKDPSAPKQPRRKAPRSAPTADPVAALKKS